MITNIHLQGIFEPFGETIRALIAREWNNTEVTPKFLSSFGHGDNQAQLDEPLRTNDFNLKDDEPAVIFREGETTINSYDNNFIELETTIYIDIFGASKFQFLIKEEIDRIIFENQPNAVKRIKKSNNSENSPIINIKQNVIEWQKIGSIPDANIDEQYAGQIECVWEKQKN